MITLKTAAEIFRLQDMTFSVHNKQFKTTVSFAKPAMTEPHHIKLVNELYAAGARFSYHMDGVERMSFPIECLA